MRPLIGGAFGVSPIGCTCWKHCTLDCNCVIVLLVFCHPFWLWLEARGFFIDYSAGFRLRHSGGLGSLAYWQCQVSSQLR